MTAAVVPEGLGGEPTAVAEAKRVSAPSKFLVVPDMAGFHTLRQWAESYEDAQNARIRCSNRIGAGADAEEFAPQLEAMRDAEHQFKLGMVRSYRRVVPAPIIAWQKATFGIGEHLLARLLGAVGHPLIATPYHWEGEGKKRELVADPPFERSLRQWWSYCGYGDATRKKRKGMSAEEAFALGNPRAKMLTHLLAEAAMKCRVEPIQASEATTRTADPLASVSAQASLESQWTRGGGNSLGRARPSLASHPPSGPSKHLRLVYDAGRVKYADREDWTLGHQHNAALRLVAKQLLRELWVAAGA